jgi:hypothetical protein
MIDMDTQLLPATRPEVGPSDSVPTQLPTGAKVAIVAALVLGSVMIAYAAFLVYRIFSFLSHLHNSF